MKTFRDVFGFEIRITEEQMKHILSRKEMKNQESKIAETLWEPDFVFQSNHDIEVNLYYRKYAVTPVTEKYLVVATKYLRTILLF